MDEKYVVRLTEQSQEYLRDITKYIAYSLQEPRTARKILDTLETAIYSLDTFPHRIPLTTEEPWHSQGIHKFLVKNYFIYFWIDETTKKVQVIGVIYTRSNQRHQLSQLNMN